VNGSAKSLVLVVVVLSLLVGAIAWIASPGAAWNVLKGDPVWGFAIIVVGISIGVLFARSGRR
jgi:hypothetical protein